MAEDDTAGLSQPILSCRITGRGTSRLQLPVSWWSRLNLAAFGDPVSVRLDGNAICICAAWPTTGVYGPSLDSLVWSGRRYMDPTFSMVLTDVSIFTPQQRCQLAAVSVAVALRRPSESQALTTGFLAVLLEGQYVHTGCTFHFPAPTSSDSAENAHGVLSIRVEASVPSTSDVVGQIVYSTAIRILPCHNGIRAKAKEAPNHIAGLTPEYNALVDIVRCVDGDTDQKYYVHKVNVLCDLWQYFGLRCGCDNTSACTPHIIAHTVPFPTACH